MAPTATFVTPAPSSNVDATQAIKNLKTPAAAQFTSADGVPLKGVKPAGDGSSAVINWEGEYKFAPIREAQTSRAMTSRYATDMIKAAVSDVVIIGAGACISDSCCASYTDVLDC